MRCRCCDSKKTKLWKNDYYCETCRKAIVSSLLDFNDDKPSDEEDSIILHNSWDDQDD